VFCKNMMTQVRVKKQTFQSQQHKRIMVYSIGLLLCFALIHLIATSIYATPQKNKNLSKVRGIPKPLFSPFGLLPSTLTDPPINAVVPAGQCQFTKKPIPATLLSKIQISPDSYVLRFGLPDSSKPLGLSTCACILAAITPDGDEEAVVRPYTPISTNRDIGTFDLLIKAYPDGKASSAITSLEVGSNKVSFLHIPPNVKIQYPFDQPKFIGMIAGGTGITPMMQALHALLGEYDEEERDVPAPKVSLLYGSKTYEHSLARSTLDDWSKIVNIVGREKRFTVNHVISQDSTEYPSVDEEESHSVMSGHINKALIERSFPSAGFGRDVKIFVCGPPALYDAVCGPRDEPEITGILGELGYTADQVVKF